MRGGARVNSGPLPKDPTSRRRRNTPSANLTELPREGRQAPPPDWPLGEVPSREVADVWLILWRLPQATAWAERGFELPVARLAVLTIAAMEPEAPSAVLTEVRQMEDRLGLNPAAMQRLRWKLADEEDGDAEVVPIAPKERRVKAVE
ncbi:hypothetical protein [Nocardiopsis sp. FR26]|uniref:phage terminase small subunit n=1 Tax=Nocardiopsis sp. FR26 TaxID=2605987 RepID=UPI001358F4F6|nr:hypothetical protein [Nocardiopsis sp. FR26]